MEETEHPRHPSQQLSRRKLIGAVLIVLISALFIYRQILFPPAPEFMKAQGREMPDLGLTAFDGSELSLHRILDASSQDKVIFSFWATWCEPCIRELPLIEKALPELAAKGVQVVLVNYDGGNPDKTMPEVKAWLISKGLKMGTYYDFRETLLEALEVDGLPFAMRIDKSSRTVEWLEMGELDWTPKSLQLN